MYTLLWASDIHLNFLGKNGAKAFGEYTAKDYPDADGIVLTGDIGEANNVLSLLTDFTQGFKKPCTFVFGNHDFYRGSIATMQKKAEKFKAATYLSHLRSDPVKLTDTSCLIGVDGWYDARAGNIYGLWMSDFELIEEYKSPQGMYTWGRKTTMEIAAIAASLARREAALGLDKLTRAVALGYKRIYFATHVPPFPEATWHEGAMSSPTFLPWFCSVTMGEMLNDFVYDHLDIEFVVLCGHTHGRGTYQHSPNLVVKTAFADYGKPQVEEQIEVP